RRLHDIPDEWGTAVNVQAMVFGNMGEDSATGVAFTRNPSTGEKAVYGEYLINAQGEDVVAGIRTPQTLSKVAREANGEAEPSMEEALPKAYEELVGIMNRLEAHYRDMQDIEFTVQRGKLWMLQTRNGKRTASAAMKIAVDMANEELITRDEALTRVDPESLDQLLHPRLDPNAARDVFAKGLPASPGAASGIISFDADDAERMANEGHDVILVRVETSPEDIHGMHAARGIVTSRGGMTSHAAVVARGMGRPCVSGAGDLRIDYQAGTASAAGVTLKRGDQITIDGTAGEIMRGAVKTIDPELSGDFATLMEWADARRRMKVRTNAETPLDAETARKYGAEGIGLCRTEHMFFDVDRIMSVREMILAETEKERRAALAQIEPMQKQDFIDLFKIMRGLPVTIRLLDPPLHEFLPKTEEDLAEIAEKAGVSVAAIRKRAEELEEFNPMLGHRGCRLGISYPEIYEMQVRAIFQAAKAVHDETGETVIPEIMIPLVGSKRELDVLKKVIDREAESAGLKEDAYIVGTMIELPRAALVADEIAHSAAFFSFGTNDLTQTTLGLSRDDSASFLDDYLRNGIFARDPFVTIDQEGVGQLVRMGVEKGRATRPDIKLGICGE
ncbi:MAG: pyruvate, phosphate dikinase, partial [Alphaproteobacteria bacterium]|nr:pyruvate, phosphate dikinase [Alphaproteobacteria bacterium]